MCCLASCWNMQPRYNKTVECVSWNCIQCMNRYTETDAISSKHVPGRKRSIRTKPILLSVMRRVKRNSPRLVSSEFQNHLCTEYFKIIWDLLHLKRNPDTYFPQLPGKNGKTDSKGCWRICNAPSVMSPLEHLHIRVSYQHAEWW